MQKHFNKCYFPYFVTPSWITSGGAWSSKEFEGKRWFKRNIDMGLVQKNNYVEIT